MFSHLYNLIIYMYSSRILNTTNTNYMHFETMVAMTLSLIAYLSNQIDVTDRYICTYLLVIN